MFLLNKTQHGMNEVRDHFSILRNEEVSDVYRLTLCC
jgi:hypothetical protein